MKALFIVFDQAITTIYIVCLPTTTAGVLPIGKMYRGGVASRESRIMAAMRGQV